MADDSAEKKHEPGDKKWREAAEKGELPRSNDINAAAVVISVTMMSVMFSGPIEQAFVATTTLYFDGSGPYDLTLPVVENLAVVTLRLIGLALLVPLGTALVAAIAASMAQTGLQLAPKALEPRWERLDVVNGFKQTYFSWTPLVELAKALLKIFAITLSVGLILWPKIRALPEVMSHTPDELMALIVDLAFWSVLAATPVLVAIGMIDYAASYHRSYENLKRTDREVRDDQKEQEGDPRFKAARRQRARRIAMAVSLNAVREADVVVTNPTHFAVALRYRRGEDDAPTVLCKGTDLVAQRIRREALRAGIPRIENRPLARALHARVEVGDPIPEDLFAPVARVLALVYRRRMSRRR